MWYVEEDLGLTLGFILLIEDVLRLESCVAKVIPLGSTLKRTSIPRIIE
jgi:hypothetical protein